MMLPPRPGRPRLTLGFAALLAAFVPAGCGPTVVPAGETDAPYGVVLYKDNVMVPARDGVLLATDIYRPTRNGVPIEEARPVVLHRTPYDKSGSPRAEEAMYFARHGYVAVVQDTRGRYNSEGVWSKYYDFDAPDGFDTVEWLAALPYTEPKVGMFGGSYGAHTQADAAKLNPPHLGALLLRQGGMSDAWDHSVGYHGAYEVGRQQTWAFNQLVGDAQFLALGEGGEPVMSSGELLELSREWLLALPLRKGLNPLSVTPNFEEYALEMATLGVGRDYAFWKGIGMNWVQYYEQTADAPMLHLGGWYDIYATGTIENFMRLSELKSSPMRLVMGPWVHGHYQPETSVAGEVEFGPEAAIADFASGYHVRWFDHHLRGRANGIESEAPVQLFVMGTGDGHMDANGRLFHGGYWRNASTWPLPEAQPVPYYLHPDGILRLTPVEQSESTTTFVFDPRNPVPTIGGGLSRFPAGGYDQREREGWFGSTAPFLPLKSRQDVVVFQTEPLEEDVEVIGPIVVRLHVSSSAPDTDFTAKLVDVYPPSADYPLGFDLNITDGIVRARYRNAPSVADLRPGVEELLTPGQTYELTIRPSPTANVFKKGHRIRVDISSSNFPRFDANPNTGEPIGANRRVENAHNTIHHSARHPSHILLPILPTGR